MARSVSPGFFHLSLPINRDGLKKDTAEKKLRELADDMKTRAGRPEEFAILNILGVLNCHLEKYDDAERDFRAVLSKDQNNLNALANLVHVLGKVYRKAEARNIQVKLEDIQKGTGVGAERAEARCLAEHAYVYACDLHEDSDASSAEMYIESNDMFRKALLLAAGRVDSSETDIWKFCIAKNAHKIFDRFSYGDSYDQAVRFMDEAVNLFAEIAQRDPGDSEYRWQSWRHLADIFRKIKLRRQVSSNHLPRALHPYIKDPELCMKRAVEVSPNNHRLLARYGNFVYSHKREFNAAMVLLDKSIRLDDSDDNFYAFSVRGVVRLKHYKWSLRKSAEDTRYRAPDRVLLELAVVDFEHGNRSRNTVWNLKDMAEVHHLLAQCSVNESRDAACRSHLNKELQYLKQAVDCQDDSRQKGVYRALGRCQFDLGEYREAIDHFKSALNLEPANAKYTGFFHELFRTYLCLMKSEAEAFPRRLKEDAVHHLRQALIKYGSSALVSHSIGSLRKEYRNELQRFAEYCETVPNNDGLVFVLRSQAPASPLSPPVRPGGSLRQTWEDPMQPGNGAQAPSAGDSENPNSLSDGLSGSLSGGPSAGSSDGIPISDVASPGTSTGSAAGSFVSPSHGTCTGPLSGSSAVGRPVAATSDGTPHEFAAASLPSAISSMSIQDTPPKSGSEPAPTEEETAAFDYNFYVVYTEQDSDWVHMTLLRELSTRKLAGCTRDNDATPGEFTLTGDIRMMTKSACVLLIIGEHFQKKCALCLHHALKLMKENGTLVLPIRKDNAAIPKEILDVINCFVVPAPPDEPKQWDKLAGCMKQHCRKVGAPMST